MNTPISTKLLVQSWTRKAPAGVFFDWDGTLADSFSFLEKAHNHALSALGKPLLGEGVFAFYFGKPREVIYPALYGDQADDAKKLFEFYVTEHHCRELKPFDDAQRIVEILAEMKIPAGVVTNKRGDFVRQEIEAFGWNRFFQVVIGAGEAGSDKPAPDPLLLAISQSGIEAPPEDIWFVGDTEIDMYCALEAGTKGLMIENNMDFPFNERIISLQNCGEIAELLLQTDKNQLKR